MAQIIKAHRASYLQKRGDAFTTLARAIVGQQISVKAAASVWQRLIDAAKPFDAATVQQMGAQGLEGLGLSARKIEYLQDLSSHFCQRPNLGHELALLSDDEVVDCLTEIRGIGPWTAEMFLIFNLQRPDVFPIRDLGLMKAISLHYRGGRALSPAGAMRLGKLWSPWRSVATWYLWRSLDPIPVEY